MRGACIACLNRSNQRSPLPWDELGLSARDRPGDDSNVDRFAVGHRRVIARTDATYGHQCDRVAPV